MPHVPIEIRRELREMAREHGEKALRTLVDVCLNGKTESARVSAASELLDRGYGRPLQQVNLEVTRYDKMDIHELQEHIERKFHEMQLLDQALSNDSTAIKKH